MKELEYKELEKVKSVLYALSIKLESVLKNEEGIEALVGDTAGPIIRMIKPFMSNIVKDIDKKKIFVLLCGMVDNNFVEAVKFYDEKHSARTDI